MEKEKIKSALARQYTLAYAAYELMELLAKEAALDEDISAFEALRIRSTHQSKYLEGIKDASRVLGIDSDEFMDAVRKYKIIEWQL